MYTRRFAIAVAGLAQAVVLAAGAGPAVAAAQPRTPFVPPRPIGACGVLNAPGSYILSANPPPKPGTCFVVTAPHVTFDLAGHTVAGAGSGAGIALAPSALGAKIESSVPGSAVVGFATGIRDDANQAMITGPNLAVAGNTANGVWLDRTTGSVVEQVILKGNKGYGIHVQLSGGAALRANQVMGSGEYGICGQTSGGTRIVNNFVAGSRGAGVYLGCDGRGNLQDVTCGGPSDKSLVWQNHILNNGDYGIAIVDQSLGNTVMANQVSGDIAFDLMDENFHCTGPTGTNTWTGNTGTRTKPYPPRA